MPNKNRFSKFSFKSFDKLNKIAKNRVVVPPMASQTADEKGFLTQKTIDHYQKLTDSGAGLIFVEYTYVHPSGKGELNQLGADSDDHIPGLQKIAEVIKASQALAGLQLVHVGGKSTLQLTKGHLMGPSGIKVPVKGWDPDQPREMNLSDIQDWISSFSAAAARASKAGFDFIELHAAHGYGLNQWLSPLTNHRQDHFGGSIENRSRLLCEIVRNIRLECPDLLLAVRLPGQDNMAGGITIQDMKWLAGHLESLGVDLLDVSSGIGGWRRPETFTGEGYLVSDASQIKTATNLPVIGVGGIESKEFIDQAIGECKIDFAAVGRAILKDPLKWRSQHL